MFALAVVVVDESASGFVDVFDVVILVGVDTRLDSVVVLNVAVVDDGGIEISAEVGTSVVAVVVVLKPGVDVDVCIEVSTRVVVEVVDVGDDGSDIGVTSDVVVESLVISWQTFPTNALQKRLCLFCIVNFTHIHIFKCLKLNKITYKMNDK